MDRATKTPVLAYSTGAMILHWAIAALIIIQLCSGFVMEHLPIPREYRFPMVQLHKTFGISVLVLTVARIVWRLFHKPPPHAPMSRPEAAVAHAVHGLFYVLMLVLPLTGWFLVSTSRTGIPTFLFMSKSLVWPHLPIPTDAKQLVNFISHQMHIYLAYTFAALIALHIAGALKHSVIDRMPSFSRMIPVGRLHRMPSSIFASLLAAVLVIVFVGGGLFFGRAGEATQATAASTASAETAAQTAQGGWVIDKAKSSLGYEIDFSNTPTPGAIGQWTASVTFDPDALDKASAHVTIDAASVTFSNDFVSPNIAGDDGLMVGAHPKIEVTLDHFEKSANGFVGKGNATVRGVSLPVEVPFTFSRGTDGRAHVEGTASLDRLAYGLGKSNDASGEWLGKTIRVKFTLEAMPANAGAPAV